MLDYDLKQPKHSPWSQLAILLMLCGVGLFVGSFVSFGLAKAILHVPLQNLPKALEDSKNANVSRIIQVISTFFFMPLPAIIFASIITRRPFKYIGFNDAISGKQAFIIIGIMIMGYLLSGALSGVNALIPIPKSAETYFKNLENEYNKEMLALANMKTTQDYLVSLFIIALLPAIFEEMFFRGSLQPVMIRLTRNAFAGILITSILFSAIHFSYYGFLPRLALGLIIGYIYYYSKNLWLSSIAHFLYNAFGVSQLYALSKQGLLNTEGIGDGSFPVYYALIAAAVLFVIFIFFKKESQVVISMYNMRKKINIDQTHE